MYHPLDREFINEFKYEIDWYRLSANDKIIWDFDFINEHQNKLQWRSLSANNGVIWNEELIDTFKNRVDWLRLGENNSVPITKDFILKYKKRLKISKYNKYLTEELLSYYDGVLWSPFNDLRRQFEVEDLKDVTAIIQGWRKLFSTVPKKGFYELYILPNVQNLDLFKLFTEKFRYGQRYYSLRPLQLDKYGLTPEFRPEEFIKENIKGKPTTKEFQKITYKSGSQEGPSRMYQIMRLQSMPYIPVILIHENIKTLLDSFSISKHEFIKIEIDPKHFKISQKFYLLYIEFDYALKQLDFDKTEFEIGERDFDTLRSHNYYKGYQKPIKSYEELKSKKEIRPKNIYVKHSYDIFSLGREIVVNEYVKNTLEKVLPNIWDFKSLQKNRIQIDQSKYDQKARTYNSHNFSLKPFTYQKKKDYQFYLDKMDRLSRSKIDIDENIISKDEFYEISKKLRITFPNILKKRILNPIQLEDYDIRDINGFETNDFYFQEHPQAYKSILIGDNGCGDSVGLMLKKNSDFELQNKLFEFLHEAGEIREYGTENYI
jgi:hypothetical protein